MTEPGGFALPGFSPLIFFQKDFTMAFDLKGFRRIAQGPTIPGVTGRNSTISKYMYVTNDDLSTVKAAGYFNALTGNGTAQQVIKGDQVDCTLVVNGTALRFDFIFDTVTSTAVTIKQAGATGTGD